MQNQIKGFRLSPGQERIWLLERDGSVYLAQCALLIKGKLDADILEQAWQEVVARQEILRTTFHRVHGRETPLQVVGDNVSSSLRRVDLRLQSPKEQDAFVEELFRKESELPFNPESESLHRISLFRLSDTQYVLHLVLPSMCADARTLKNLLHEISESYRARLRGTGASREVVQYVQFSEWQNELFEDDNAAEALNLRQRQNVSDIPPPTLTFLAPRDEETKFQPAYLDSRIEAQLVAELDAYSRKNDTSPEIFLMACWYILLWRLLGQPDISMGVVLDGRKFEELQSVLGLLAKTVPVPCRIDGRLTLADILEQLSQSINEAHDWQEYFRWEEKKDRSGVVGYSTIHFEFHEVPPEVSVDGLTFSLIKHQAYFDRFTVKLNCVRRQRSLMTEFHYNSNSLKHEDIKRLAEQYQTLLKSLLENTEKPIAELEIISTDERRQLLVASAATPRANRTGKCLHELFEEQAALTPEAVAVLYDGFSLSYSLLNSKANQLAHHLRSLGLSPEQPVALCLHRSPRMVIALLAVLKAGGAYLPLDPAYPPARLAFMVADAGVRLLITEQESAASVPAGDYRLIVLDGEDAAVIEQQERTTPHGTARGAAIGGEQLAYIIYTSGSTGQPKGVLVSHANVERLFAETSEWFQFSEQDVWTLFHSYAFDFSVWELWGALLYGGRLIVVPYLVTRSPEAFYQLLCQQGVTVLNQTPSAFRQLMKAEEALGAEAAAGLKLRQVIFGGEALELQSLWRWFESHAEERPQLVNMYGITETTVHVTYRPLRMEDLIAKRGSVIGRAIPDLWVYVLDEQMRLVPFGVAGELYVGGDGLARGYLGRPSLTAERFVPDPFSGESGARLYKTGDLARRLADGEIEYLGRIDHQVKIRGFRIELGEIEAAVREQAGVRDAVVMARSDGHEEKRLVAYVVVEAEATVGVAQLRGQLRERLPEHMVPSAVVLLEEFPLTPSGKLDRAALPAPSTVRPETEEAYTAARTPIEEVLAATWSEVLSVERVGINDNFFNLGGDSIRSVRVVALAKNRGLSLLVEDIFEHQTIASLARLLETREERTELASPTEPFSLISDEDRLKLPDGVEDAYPLTMLQMGMLYHLELKPDSPAYHNINSYHLQGTYSIESIQEAVEQVIARHPVLRTSFDFYRYSQPLQLVHSSAPLQVQVHDLRHLSLSEQNEAIRAFAQAEKMRFFDLSQPPLIRFHLHLRSEETFQFTLTELHAILDGWSTTSMFADVMNRSSAILNNNRLDDDAPLPTIFREYVLLEKLALQSEECERFWAQKLSGGTPVKPPRWPSFYRTDGRPQGLEEARHNSGEAPREEREFDDAGEYKVELIIDDELFEGLNRLSRSAAVPFKSVLLAAHLKVMSIISGQDDIVCGLLTNGRPEVPGGDQVYGLFLNSLPLRFQLLPGTWFDLVHRAFEAERETLPFRRYPMAALQQKWGQQTLLETLFGYLHFHAAEKALRSGEIKMLSEGNIDWTETHFPLLSIFHRGPFPHTYSYQLKLVLTCLKDVLTEEQAKTICGYYDNILREMAADPSQRHERRSFLSPGEERLLVADWNNTSRDYSAERFIHQDFETQAERTPEAIAVVFESQELTYRQLNVRANRLASYLKQKGVGTETLVGVCMERSLEMVVSLLGILKSGGAYVPFDPDYPAERLSFMLADSRVPVLLTQQSLIERLPTHGAEVICVDSEWHTIALASAENPLSEVKPDQLAYVIYTSGSTGKPKGAGNTHRGIRNRLLWMQEAFRLTDSDCVLQKTPFSFDVSVWEFFWPLMVGARLVVARPAGHQDSAYLVRLIADQQITTLHFVPSMLQIFLAERGLETCTSLRRVICSGEALSFDLQVRFFQNLSAELHNLYGPTEASIDVTFWQCEPDDKRLIVPIGRAIANTQIYLLNAQLQPVPIGIAGELYIGGDGLARGYLGNPALTAERFIPNPFGTEPGARLYHTGDLARWLPDGVIEYLGRVDHQVKIRGFRIELGEIEAALGRHSSVRESVVVARAGANGDQSLVAYLTVSEPLLMTTGELRNYLREKLPAYMVPSTFVILDKLPLLPNGKVDRRALPAPGLSALERQENYVAPRTPLEESLARIVAEVLGVGQIGVNDNFFELGGHSLLATRLLFNVRDAFDVVLPLQAVFENPTVAGLAASVETMRWAMQSFPAAAAETTDDAREYGEL
jgi:amino acid adenylation domain-containing protein